MSLSEFDRMVEIRSRKIRDDHQFRPEIGDRSGFRYLPSTSAGIRDYCPYAVHGEALWLLSASNFEREMKQAA
jgi:hypothetical protein